MQLFNVLHVTVYTNQGHSEKFGDQGKNQRGGSFPLTFGNSVAVWYLFHDIFNFSPLVFWGPHNHGAWGENAPFAPPPSEQP